MLKYLNLGIALISFVPILFTIVFVLSSVSKPKTFFYPAKRTTENIVLTAASFNPAVKAAYRTSLTANRFDEAEILLIEEGDTSGLDEFVFAVRSAKNEIVALPEGSVKAEQTQNLARRIDTYQQQLSEIQQNKDVVVKKQPTQRLPATFRRVTPTPTAAVPTPTPTPPTIDDKIKDTQDELDTIRNNLGALRDAAESAHTPTPTTVASTSTPIPTPTTATFRPDQGNQGSPGRTDGGKQSKGKKGSKSSLFQPTKTAEDDDDD